MCRKGVGVYSQAILVSHVIPFVTTQPVAFVFSSNEGWKENGLENIVNIYETRNPENDGVPRGSAEQFPTHSSLTSVNLNQITFGSDKSSKSTQPEFACGFL